MEIVPLKEDDLVSKESDDIGLFWPQPSDPLFFSHPYIVEMFNPTNTAQPESQTPTSSQSTDTLDEQPINIPQPEMQIPASSQLSYPLVDQPTDILQPATQQILPQQTSPAPVIQPEAQVMPPFRQREAQSERYHHNYVPIVCDDVIGCVTTVFKMTVDASNRLSMADYARLSQECLHTAKRNSTDIAYLYIHSAEDYSTKIRLDISYIHAHENRERKVIFVDKDTCEQGLLYKELTRNGIHCFNVSLSHRVISEHLYQLILYKMSGTKHELPEECGFAEIDSAWCFVTEEYCELKGIPSVTDRSFAMELENAVSSEQSEEHFIRFACTCHDSKQFLLLNMLRIMGLLSTPLDSCGIRFNKIVFLHGDGEQLSPYLQVYDRNYMAARPDSINVPEDKLEGYFENQKDCVILLEDKSNTTNYQKKNGVEAINYLSGMIYDHINSVYNDSLFVTVVFSERLSQMIQSNKALVIDYSYFSAGSDYSTSKLFALTYYLDDLIVKRVCSNFNDFYNCVQQNKLHYENKAKQFKVDAVTFTCLMLVYHEMVKQFGKLNSLVPESEMESYLAGILAASDKSYNGGSIAEEFKTRLNQMLANGEIELVRNSSMNDCFGSTGTKPIIFNDDQWLYIPAETFVTICEKLTLSNTNGSVRKALHSEGWLRTSEDNMTYKATLYGIRHRGKLHVTAVMASILSNEAMKMQRGGMFNFTPCKDSDADKILLGTDEHGRNIYWSIGHDDLRNTHLLVNGSSGTGKSTTVNLIVKELFAKNKQIIYVDFSHSDTPEKLKRNGLDEAFQSEHIIRYELEEFLSDNDLLKLALMDI